MTMVEGNARPSSGTVVSFVSLEQDTSAKTESNPKHLKIDLGVGILDVFCVLCDFMVLSLVGFCYVSGILTFL